MYHLLGILFVCCLTGVQSADWVRYPAGKFLEGCFIRNLTVYESSNRAIVNNQLCNHTADYLLLNSQPSSVNFMQLMKGIAPSYLLVVIDRTAKKPLWMISNITLYNFSLIPSSNRYMQTLLAYQKPYTTPGSQNYVEYLVFEEYRPQPSSSFSSNAILYNPNFNLSTWIDSQHGSGISLYGPVAGAGVLAHQQYPAGPVYPPGPQQPNNQSHNKPKNNAGSHFVNGILLALAMIFGGFRL